MRYSTALRLFAGVCIIIASAVFLWFNREQFSIVKDASIFYVVTIFICMVPYYLVMGEINRFLLQQRHLHLATYESFKLSVLTGFYNLITPLKGGMAVRAMYLKKKYDFAYTDFISTLAASYVLFFLVAGLAGLLASWWLFAVDGSVSWIILLIFAGTTMTMLSVIVVAPQFELPSNKYVRKFVEVINSWRVIRRNTRAILIIFGLSVVQLLIGSIMLMLQFNVFNYKISLAQAVFLTSISSLSVLIAITPAGLGVQEAITVFSGLTLGIAIEQSLAAALIGRVISILGLTLVGLYFSYTIGRKGFLKEEAK